MRNAFPLFLAALLLIGIAQNPAEAWPFHKKQPKVDRATEIQTYQAPPLTTMTELCEPLRQRAVLLNSGSRGERMRNRLEAHRLEKQYNKCRLDFSSAEYNYLKHAQEPASPSLPGMDTLNPSAPPATPAGTAPALPAIQAGTEQAGPSQPIPGAAEEKVQ